eukprot:tig00021795_g23537.t1
MNAFATVAPVVGASQAVSTASAVCVKAPCGHGPACGCAARVQNKAFFGDAVAKKAARAAPSTSFSVSASAEKPVAEEKKMTTSRRTVMGAAAAVSLQALLSVKTKPAFAAATATKAFTEQLEALYPGAVTGEAFIKETQKKLNPLGFNGKNVIPAICLCRDELCQPLFRKIEGAWAQGAVGAFDLSGLAGMGGMLSAGVTAFGAAEAHSPQTGDDKKEKYVFIAAPHIAIGEDGTIGACNRVGRAAPSNACGALVAIQGRYKNGKMDKRPEVDFGDLEESLLAQLVFDKLGAGGEKSLPEITQAAAEAQAEYLQGYIEKSTKGKNCDYAVFTGIQIHGPGGSDYIFPTGAYAVVNGEKKTLA